MISFYVAKREFSKETKRGIDSAKEVQKPSYFEWKTSAAFNKKDTVTVSFPIIMN
ncbi:MAG: hypothetical protein ACLS5O_00995 [[Clostridium] leptum]|jgi:hypothetical protein